MKINNIKTKENNDLTSHLDKSKFNDVELKYLDLLKKKEKYNLPLTKSEKEIVSK
jgi:hypothetical protein